MKILDILLGPRAVPAGKYLSPRGALFKASPLGWDSVHLQGDDIHYSIGAGRRLGFGWREVLGGVFSEGEVRALKLQNTQALTGQAKRANLQRKLHEDALDKYLAARDEAVSPQEEVQRLEAELAKTKSTLEHNRRHTEFRQYVTRDLMRAHCHRVTPHMNKLGKHTRNYCVQAAAVDAAMAELTRCTHGPNLRRAYADLVDALRPNSRP